MGGCSSKKAVLDATKSALSDDVLVFFVLGGPGSGKGTQCEKISAKYGCKHISAGDLLRAEVAKGTALGQQCESLMKEGQLVPVEVTLKLLENAMMEATEKSFLIDGFPRAIEQASRFESEIKPATAVIFYECSESTMTERILERGKTSGRADDTEETIKKRLKTFVEMSAPVAKFYEAQKKCHAVSADGDPEVIFQKTSEILDQYLQPTVKQDNKVTQMEEEQVREPESEAINGTKAAANEALDVTEESEKQATDANEEQEKQTVDTAEELKEPIVDEQEEKKEEKINVSPEGRVIFVLGGPGSGKGTQCEKIVNVFGCKHISVGDLLRAEVQSGSELGKECETVMTEGNLVSLEITMTLLKQALASGDADYYLIDGFPRSVEQAQRFEEEVKPCECVLFFDCPENVMLERMTERSKSSGRADDNQETMQKRLKTFLEVSAPVKKYFSDLGKCHTISADNSPFLVFKDVQTALQPLFPKKETALENKLLILQDADANLKDCFSGAMVVKDWTVEWKTWNIEEADAIELSILSSKAVVWNPNDPAQKEDALQNLLKKAEKQNTLVLELEALAALKEDPYASQKNDSEAPDTNTDTQKVELQLTFDIPIQFLCYPADSHKETELSTCFKADDAEFAPLLAQFKEKDLSTIQSCAHGEPMAPFGRVIYNVTPETSADEQSTYEIYFPKYYQSFPDLSQHLPLVEAFASKFIEYLSI